MTRFNGNLNAEQHRFFVLSSFVFRPSFFDCAQDDSAQDDCAQDDSVRMTAFRMTAFRMTWMTGLVCKLGARGERACACAD